MDDLKKLPTDDLLASLDNRQREFLENYLTHFNGTRAAKAAGYGGPKAALQTVRALASKTLAHPTIQELLRRRWAEQAMTSAEVLARMAEIARGDIGDFLMKYRGKIRVDPDAVLGDKSFVVKRWQRTSRGESIELHDSLSALIQIGKNIGLFTERIDLNNRSAQVEVHFYMPDNGRAES